MTMRFIALMLAVCVLSSGCGKLPKSKKNYWRASQYSYQESALLPPVKIPADLDYVHDHDRFPIPSDLPCAALLTSPELTPPGFGAICEDAC